MYKYLLWDIDGTVLDFLASEAYAIRALFEKYNLGECSDEMLKMYSGINTKYWQMLERGEMTKPEILVGRFCEFFGLIGADVTIAENFNRDYQITLGDHIEFVGKEKEVYDRAIDYWNDSKYYLEKKDMRTAFGCIEYSHGLLDALRMIHGII